MSQQGQRLTLNSASSECRFMPAANFVFPPRRVNLVLIAHLPEITLAFGAYGSAV